MPTATNVNDIAGWEGDDGAKMYLLTPARAGRTHVIVATVDTEAGMQTFVFSAGDDGALPTSGDALSAHPGVVDHADVLRRFGYELEGSK